MKIRKIKKTLSLILALAMAGSALIVTNAETSDDTSAEAYETAVSADLATYTSTYSVTGGLIYFNSNTGAIVACDESVTSVNIPSSIDGVAVTAIDDFAFEGCYNITSVTLPSSITSIGNYAFAFCYDLANINIPDSVTSIGWCAFHNCDFTSITIPSSVTSIGEMAFACCFSLTRITLSSNITTISYGMFSECYKLSSITIPSSVTSIELEAFFCCYDLTSIDIPDSVTYIQSDAFWNCPSLTDIYYGGSESEWNAITIESENEWFTSATIHFGKTDSSSNSSTTTTSTTTTTTTTTESTTESTTEAETETTTKKSSSGGGGGGSSYSGASTSSGSEGTTEATTEKATATATEEEAETADSNGADTAGSEETLLTEVVKVTIGSTDVQVGSGSYETDAAPYIQEDSSSTLVPLRFVALAIAGGDVENADTSDMIDWDGATKTATITAGGTVVKFTAGSDSMIVNGAARVMDNGVKAEITNDRMYIPFRALGTALGVNVEWDAATKTATYSPA